MKKIVYILGIICAMIMQSCLDLEPKTQLADTNYWKSPEHFKLFATQFYGWSADFRCSTTVSTPIFARICLPAAR